MKKLTYPYHFHPNIWDCAIEEMCFVCWWGRGGGLLEERICGGTKSFWSTGHFLELSRMGSKNLDGILKSLLPAEERSSKWGGKKSIQCLNILLPTVLEVELGYCYFYQGASTMKSKVSWGWMEKGWKRQNQKHVFLLKYFAVIKLTLLKSQKIGTI